MVGESDWDRAGSDVFTALPLQEEQREGSILCPLVVTCKCRANEELSSTTQCREAVCLDQT